jgi:hypothetical protein
VAPEPQLAAGKETVGVGVAGTECVAPLGAADGSLFVLPAMCISMIFFTFPGVVIFAKLRTVFFLFSSGV